MALCTKSLLIFMLVLSLTLANPHLGSKSPHQPSSHHPHNAKQHHPHPVHVAHISPHHQGNHHNCPSVCRCHRDIVLVKGGLHGHFNDHHAGGPRHQSPGIVVNCSGAAINQTLPMKFPVQVHTLILDDNYFPELTSDLFNSSSSSSMDVSRLEVLSICGSYIDTIHERAFERLTGLRELRLNFNRIKVLPAKLFENNTNLQTLSLTNNPLDISTVVSTAFFQSLPSLNKLDISHSANPLLHLPESFTTLTNLSELYLRGSVFPNITNEFFSPLGKLSLIKLDLSEAEIQAVDDEAFTPFSQLHELILSKATVTTQNVENILNGLSNSSISVLNLDEVFSRTGHNHTVTKHMFRHLNSTKLKILYFRGNRAGLHGKLPAKLFQPLKALHELHVDDCGLSSVSDEAFHGLNHLKLLSMTENLLSCSHEHACTFLSIGFTLKQLQILDLSYNQITDSGYYNFSNSTFPSLENLNLTGNKLRSVSVGLFGDLSKLKTLDLSENPIEDISQDAFVKLSSLLTLHIENCPSLSHIKEGAFNGLETLKTLNLQNSGIVHIHHSALSHFGHLEYLYMQSNRLGRQGSSIERISIKKSVLTVINLSDNQLSTLPTGLLHRSHSLTMLLVNNNRLFNCSQFHSLFGSKISYLNASYNQFAQPTVGCFEGMEHLETVNLAGNPFVCSCELKPFTEWLVSKKIATEQGEEYMCIAPEVNSGKNMLRMSYSNWTCHGKTAMIWSFFFVTFGAIATCLGIIGFRKLKRNGCRMNSNGDSSSGEGTRSLKESTTNDSCMPYSPLEEEESPDTENGSASAQYAISRPPRRNTDYDVENNGCLSNGILISPDHLNSNGKVGKNGTAKKKPRRTTTGETSTPSQSRAFTRDTSSKSNRPTSCVDPDAMLLTSDHDSVNVDGHLEDSV